MKNHIWVKCVFLAMGLSLCFLFSPLTAESQNLFEISSKQDEQRPCLSCHRQPNLNSNEGVLASNAFCNECHSQDDCVRTVNATEVSLKVPEDIFANHAHKYNSCIECHTDVARSPHTSLTGPTCQKCHSVHSEKLAHAPHLRVDCAACHYESKFVNLNKETNQVQLAHFNAEDDPISLAEHKLADFDTKQACKKCHFSTNQVGAPAAVLPAKSFLCLGCHNAPLHVGSAYGLYWIPFLVLLFGLFTIISMWFKGALGTAGSSTEQKISISSESIWNTIFSRRILDIIKTAIFDIILQRRILRQGVERWSIHSLIYLAFLGRLLLSLFTVLIYNAFPESDLALALIDKNHPFVAVVHDLLGLFILIGVIWALYKRFISKSSHLLSEEQDTLALAIIGLLIAVGFVLEGTRILLTQIPASISAYSFIGFIIAKCLSIFPFGWQIIYSLLWYLHVLIWAAFLIYLPFGKLKHIIFTPLNLIIDSVSDEKKH